MTAHATCATSAATSACDGVPLTVSTVVVCSQSGALSGTRFWKNDLPLAPWGKRCISTGRPPIVRSSGSATARVVADEVELGLAALGEEDLVRAGDPHLAPGELDHLCVVGHRRTVARTQSISIVAGSER